MPGCAARCSTCAPTTCASPPGEAQRFLGERLGLSLDAGEIAALDARTEGWPAALYLAALRLRLGDDVATVMEQLGDEDLFGALTDELLRSSPEHERRFIVETSVLDRFNASLCARLLGDDLGRVPVPDAQLAAL